MAAKQGDWNTWYMPHDTTQTTTSTRILALACGALPGLFLLITSTTHLVDGWYVYDVKRMLQLCLMLVLFLAATLNPGLRNAFAIQLGRIPAWVKALLALIIAIGITSSIVHATSGMHLAYSLLEVALLSMLVLAALVIAACRMVAGEVFDQVAITLLAMTAIAVGIQELLGVAAALSNGLEYFFRISLMHYSWPRFYNQVQAWTLPVLAALPLIWSRSKSELLRSTWFQAIVCLSALALHWYIILMTGGRGVALSLVASIVLGCTFFRATRKPAFQIHLPALALGTLLYFAIVQLNANLLEINPPEARSGTSQSAQQKSANPEDWYEKQSGDSRLEGQSIAGRLSWDSSGRVAMWRGSVRDIGSNPLLGNGPMNYACTGPVHRAGHPHNFPLQFAGEWGLAAITALACIVAFSFLTLFQANWRQAAPAYSAQLVGFLTIALTAAAIYSFLSGVLVMPASQVAGALIGGWLMDVSRRHAGAVIGRRWPATSVLVSGLLISLIVTVFSGGEAGKNEFRSTLIPAIDSGIPRYWQQGKLCKYFADFD